MNSVAVKFPDYSTYQSLISSSSSSGTTVSAPSDGWIFPRMQLDNNTTRSISINGTVVIEVRSGAEYLNGNEAGGAMPVKKGDSIKAIRATVYFCKMRDT